MHFAKTCTALYAMRFRFALVLGAAVAVLAAGPAGADTRSIVSGGQTREYILHQPPPETPVSGELVAPGQTLPPGDETRPRPLVIALHGAMQPAHVMQRYLDLDQVADRNGFVVAYPKGMNLLWNDGRGSVAGIMPIVRPRDDAAFILNLVRKLVDEGIADPDRVYMMGFSNGAFLTAFMACTYPEPFAAFATLMATTPVSYTTTCKPPQPIPILMMNGTYDPIVPWVGRPTPGANLMSASESARFFAGLNGCGAPVKGGADTTGGQTPSGVSILRWNECRGGVSVAFYEVEGGHQPPTASAGPMDMLASVILGPRRGGLDAPAEIWSFFQRYTRYIAPTPGALPVRAPLPIPSPLRQRGSRT